MKVVSEALHPQSGAVSPFLIGFAAGALLVGTVAFGPRPAPATHDSFRIPVASGTAQGVVRVEAIATYTPDRLAVAGPWFFESATAAAAGAPGKTRPDLLSAPEGWTYDAAERTE